MEDLTPKQTQVLKFIQVQLKKNKPFPSLSEIGDHFSVSRNTAKVHVNALEKKNVIKKRDQRVSPFLMSEDECNPAQFQIMAHVSAGVPDMVEDQQSRFVQFNQTYFGAGQVKAVIIAGDSMLGDSICDGDIALVKLQRSALKRDIVAVRVEGEGVTIKRLNITKEGVELIPSNPQYSVKCFSPDRVQVIGKIVGIVRRT